MRVAAFSLAGIAVDSPGGYTAGLTALFEKLQISLAVLPAHSSFLLYAAERGPGEAGDFLRCFKLFMKESAEWNKKYLQLHSSLARKNNIYLVAGTMVEEEGGRFFHTSYCFGPEGGICGRQRQTHLSREERELGLNRGEELHLFDVGGMKTGLIVGTDARHPEVGRILALEGAHLIVHSGALTAASEKAAQPAGIWAQVQQNQFWAVEAQLKRSICGRSFDAHCAVIGPCEVTPGMTGYLHEDAEKDYALAGLVDADRRRIKNDYPLLNLLQPGAYREELPHLYR